MSRLIYSVIIGSLLASPALSATYGGGSGAPDDPYQIWTAEQMNNIGVNPIDWNKNYKLMADIDMSIYTGTQYNIIGNEAKPFTGTFDGNAHIIRNLTYTTTGVDYVGLFGFVVGGRVNNLELMNMIIAGNIYVGGLCGCNYEGTISTTARTIT